MPVRSTRISTSPGCTSGSGTSRSHSPGAASAFTSARIVRASALPRRRGRAASPHDHLGTAATASQATRGRRRARPARRARATAPDPPAGSKTNHSHTTTVSSSSANVRVEHAPQPRHHLAVPEALVRAAPVVDVGEALALGVGELPEHLRETQVLHAAASPARRSSCSSSSMTALRVPARGTSSPSASYSTSSAAVAVLVPATTRSVSSRRIAPRAPNRQGGPSRESAAFSVVEGHGRIVVASAWPASEFGSALCRCHHRAAWVRSVTPMRREDAGEVRLHGLLADAELLADQPVAMPSPTSAQHLPLARRELRLGRRTPPVDQRRAARGSSGASPRSAARMPVVQGRGVGVLEQEADRAGVDRRRDPRAVGERREHDDADVRVLGEDRAGGRDAVHAGHRQVHEDDVGPHRADQSTACCRRPPRRRTPRRRSRREQPEPCAHDAWSSTTSTRIMGPAPSVPSCRNPGSRRPPGGHPPRPRRPRADAGRRDRPGGRRP